MGSFKAELKCLLTTALQKMDVQQLKGSCAGPLTKQQLLSTISNRDLLLSNQYDENDVLTVLDKCIVVNRRPGEEMPLNAVRPGVFVSRYSISFGDTPGVSVVTAYDGENQPWPDDMIEGAVADKSDGDQKDLHERMAGEAVDDGTTLPQPPPFRDNSIGDADTDGTSEESGSETNVVRLSEGTNTKGKIQIGPGHQANLEPFDFGQPVVSRKPQVMWLKEAGAAVDMDKYLDEAAEILHKYLGQKGLMTPEPYFPFPEEQMHEFLKELNLSSMTLSNLSTGSSMSKRRNRLTRECKLDKLIELLHTKEYSIEEALKAIILSPESYVTVWSKIERKNFDGGFRRYSGSLRMIAANSVVSKNFKDVVDFHYRYMVPGQFRRFQDKKREHAVRMMEIIENRRSEGSSSTPRDDSRRRPPSDGQNGKTDWSKTGVSDVVGVVEERLSSAKDLLFDIEQAVGTEKMKQICRAIKSWQSKSISELKDRAVEILHSHPTLRDRFLDYLPQRYRC